MMLDVYDCLVRIGALNILRNPTEEVMVSHVELGSWDFEMTDESTIK